ncbi:hypothetical protein [Bradyrhizobium sp. LB11.1]|uniref:hypothetical protein n=1 Tax=Bradyrhizobium sp. LB11.1 TaxID=3156326 RepID=UPI003396D717
MERKIEALQATTAPHPDIGSQEVKQALIPLQQAVQDVRANQQKISAQVDDLRRKTAAEGGERKLLSDQLGALSSRVDALSSANGDSNITAPPQSQKKGNRKR